MSADTGNVTILVLFGLTAAFDTIDLRVVLDKLKNLDRVGQKSSSENTLFQFWQNYVDPSPFKGISNNIIDYFESSPRLTPLLMPYSTSNLEN